MVASDVLVVAELELVASEVVVNSEVLTLAVVDDSVLELLVVSLVVVMSEELLVESVAEFVELQDEPESVTVTVTECAEIVIVLSTESADTVTV